MTEATMKAMQKPARKRLFLVALTVPMLAAAAAAVLAEEIVCDGILGNSGEQGAALVRFPGAPTAGTGIVCDRYGSLWDRGGKALNCYAADGRLLASYKLPNTQVNRNADALSLLGDTLVLRLGGQLYSLAIDAPAGAEVEPMNVAADTLSFSSYDGQLVASKGAEVFLVNAMGEQQPIATLAKHPQSVEFGPDGGVSVVLDGQVFRVAAGGANQLDAVGPSPGERPQFLHGYWYGSGWHSTLRRFDAQLQPAPGVVLGGNSGAFIGHVDEQSEIVNGRGLARLRSDLFAVSGFGGIVHLLQWQPAVKRFEPVRRIGPLPACSAIGLDSEGRVWCGSGQWNWSDGPASPQRLGISAPERVFGLANLGDDSLCGFGLQWGKPAVFFGTLQKELVVRRIESQTALPQEAIAVAITDVDKRRAVVVLERNGRASAAELHGDGRYKADIGPVQFATAKPVTAFTSLAAAGNDTLLAAGDGFVIEFGRDGEHWQEHRRWNACGAENKDNFGPIIRLAADSGRLWVSDTERNRVLCLDLATREKLGAFGTTDSPGDDLAHLAGPTTLAARGDRAVVYDSGNQRLVKLRLME